MASGQAIVDRLGSGARVLAISPRLTWCRLIIALFDSAASIAQLWCLGRMLDAIATDRAEPHRAVLFLSFYSLCTLGKGVVSSLLAIGASSASAMLRMELESRLLGKLVDSRAAFCQLETPEGNRVLSRIEQAMPQVETLHAVLIGAIGNVFSFVGIFAIGASLPFGWMLPAAATATAAVAFLVQSKSHSRSLASAIARIQPERRVQRLRDTLTRRDYLAEACNTPLRSMAFDRWVQLKGSVLSDRRNEDRRLTAWQCVDTGALNVAVVIGASLLVWLALDGRVTAGSIVLGIGAIQQAGSASRGLAGLAARFWGVSGQVGEFFNFVSSGQGRPTFSPSASPDPNDAPAEIVLRDVWYTHSGASQPAVRDFSASFKHGELTVIVGPNGSGKSTLLRLLAGWAIPDHGELTAVGSDGKIIAPDVLRELTFCMSQTRCSLPLNVRDYLRAEASARTSPERLREALMQVGLADDLVQAEMMLERILMKDLDGGIAMSGGELQRLALARVLLSDRPVVLLDEPTTHLSTEAIGWMIEESRQRSRRAIWVIASHDPLMIAAADRVIELSAQGSGMRHGTRDSECASEVSESLHHAGCEALDGAGGQQSSPLRTSRTAAMAKTLAGSDSS